MVKMCMIESNAMYRCSVDRHILKEISSKYDKNNVNFTYPEFKEALASLTSPLSHLYSEPHKS